VATSIFLIVDTQEQMSSEEHYSLLTIKFGNLTTLSENACHSYLGRVSGLGGMGGVESDEINMTRQLQMGRMRG
jgi:hypothetical protein